MVVRMLVVYILGTLLASAQGRNLGVNIKEGGAHSGNSKAAVQKMAVGLHDPSRITYPRLYCTADGNSHFENVTVELSKIEFAPPAAPIHIGGKVAASNTFFGGFESGWGARDLESGLYHPAPAAQFSVVLGGDFSIITTDGETKHFGRGDVFRVEDIPPCKGHITVVGDKPGFFLFAR